MNPWLRQIQPATRRRDWRRLGVLLGVTLAASVAWHAARPAVIRAVARQSVGAMGREPLVVDALRGLYSDRVPALNTSSLDLRSVRGAHGGSFVWRSEGEPRSTTEISMIWRYDIADENLVRRGSLLLPEGCFLSDTAVDRDGDGQVEALTTGGFWQPPGSPGPGWTGPVILTRLSVVRLDPNRSRLLGVFLFNQTAATTLRGSNVAGVWRQEGPREMGKLIVRHYDYQPAARGRTTRTSKDLGVFGFDRPGGGLVVRAQPSDDEVEYWLPEAGETWDFAVEQDVKELMDSIMDRPGHSGLTAAAYYSRAATAVMASVKRPAGASPASAPTSAAASAPAIGDGGTDKSSRDGE